jgi:lipopolysaccharide export system protein LptA
MARDGKPKEMVLQGRDFRALAVILAAALALSFSPAWGQSQIGGFAGLSGSDSKKPIDIESDRLEVDDKNHTAIFIGNVSATQGDSNLKAPRLEVFYENASQPQAADKRGQTPKAAKPVQAASAGASGDPVSNGQIKRIHAMGGKVVVINTKDQQEATGDDAIYEVKAQLITMTGKEVVLTQNKNKVKGTKLVIDLATGKATVLDQECAAGAVADGKGHCRIRAVFQQGAITGAKPNNPSGDTKPKGAAATQPASQKAVSPQQAAPSTSWQTQSR